MPYQQVQFFSCRIYFPSLKKIRILHKTCQTLVCLLHNASPIILPYLNDLSVNIYQSCFFLRKREKQLCRVLQHLEDTSRDGRVCMCSKKCHTPTGRAPLSTAEKSGANLNRRLLRGNGFIIKKYQHPTAAHVCIQS